MKKKILTIITSTILFSCLLLTSCNNKTIEDNESNIVTFNNYSTRISKELFENSYNEYNTKIQGILRNRGGIGFDIRGKNLVKEIANDSKETNYELCIQSEKYDPNNIIRTHDKKVLETTNYNFHQSYASYEESMIYQQVDDKFEIIDNINKTYYEGEFREMYFYPTYETITINDSRALLYKISTMINSNEEIDDVIDDVIDSEEYYCDNNIYTEVLKLSSKLDESLLFVKQTINYSFDIIFQFCIKDDVIITNCSYAEEAVSEYVEGETVQTCSNKTIILNSMSFRSGNVSLTKADLINYYKTE